MTTAEQWIAKRRDHEGRGQRLHHSDYDRALDALEKVLELAADQDAVYDSDLIAAIESALGIEAGDDR